MQDMAEQEFAKAKLKEREEMERLHYIQMMHQQAKTDRESMGLSVTEWVDWNQYMQALELKLDKQRDRVQAVSDTVEECLKVVKEAHQEQERWSTVIEQHRMRERLTMRAEEQKHADERAVIRHGRNIS